MNTTTFVTIVTTLRTEEGAEPHNNRRLTDREADLNQHGRNGYTLTGTTTVTTPDTTTLIDTLQKVRATA